MSNDEFYFDWWKHEDNLFTNRGNFFLVSHSLLMAASSKLFEINSYGYAGFLCFFGLSIAMLWTMVNHAQRVCVVNQLKSILQTNEPRWGALQEKRWPWERPHIMMGYCLPILFICLWTGMLVMALPHITWFVILFH